MKIMLDLGLSSMGVRVDTEADESERVSIYWYDDDNEPHLFTGATVDEAAIKAGHRFKEKGNVDKWMRNIT